MANGSKKTEHAGAKKGQGAYWGYKKDAKDESNRRRRSDGRNEADDGASERQDLGDDDNE